MNDVSITLQEEACSAQDYTLIMTCTSAKLEMKPKVKKLEQYIVVEFEATSDVLPTNNVYECVLIATNAMGSAESNGTITASEPIILQDANAFQYVPVCVRVYVHVCMNHL